MAKRQPRRRKTRASSLAAHFEKHPEQSQRAFAARYNISQASVSRYVLGLAVPHPALALRISRDCGIPIESFQKTFVERQQRDAAGDEATA